MSKTNEGANASFRGMSRSYPLYVQRNNNILRNVRIEEKTVIDNYLLVKRTITVGNDVEKDMDNENYTDELDPHNAQSDLFPGMADFIEDNIEAGDKNEGDRFQASYWNDLGNDIFDDWGYFFFYDVARGKYYFPLLTPQNQSDGIVTEQYFNCFGVQFGIRHGWRAKGIFMMDVSCSDNTFDFRFGCYGNWGAGNDDAINNDKTASYGEGQTLFYHYYEDMDNSDSSLYAYFSPYRDSDKLTQTHQCRINPENNDENSLITKVIREGVKVYFSAKNDVKEYVITDIMDGDITLKNGDVKAEGDIRSDGNIYSYGSIVSNGYNLGKTSVYTLDNSDYAPGSRLINGYFRSNYIESDREFILPSAQLLYNAIPNCQEGTSFRFTINNSNNIEGGHSWNLNTEGAGYIDLEVKNSTIPPGTIISYLVIIQFGEGPYATILQISEPQQYFG